MSTNPPLAQFFQRKDPVPPVVTSPPSSKHHHCRTRYKRKWSSNPSTPPTRSKLCTPSIPAHHVHPATPPTLPPTQSEPEVLIFLHFIIKSSQLIIQNIICQYIDDEVSKLSTTITQLSSTIVKLNRTITNTQPKSSS